MTERPNNKEILFKPNIDGINRNQWKLMIYTFLKKVFVTGTFRYMDAVVYYTGSVVHSTEEVNALLYLLPQGRGAPNCSLRK